MLMALIPGVGPITAFGLLGAAIRARPAPRLVRRWRDKMEKSSIEGLPEDEIFVYEDALRKGRSVVVALAEDEDSGRAFANS